MDVDSLSTFDVVALARGCIERGEIAQAVRYMTLLNGEPANVSKVSYVSELIPNAVKMFENTYI